MPVATMSDAAQLAKAFAQAHVMGASNDAEGMLAVALIQEIGLVRAEANYHLMMGRLSKKAEAILADFVKAGGKYKIVQRDANGSKIIASLGETQDAEFSLSWEDAQKEAFVYKNPSMVNQKDADKRVFKDNYATPRKRMQMLWARLVSDMGRAMCPASTEGLYVPEEVGDFDELRKGEPKTINVDEVKKRAEAQHAQEVDYTVCPDGFDDLSRLPWAEINSEILEAALESEDKRVTHTHKAAIRLVLEQRKEVKE